MTGPDAPSQDLGARLAGLAQLREQLELLSLQMTTRTLELHTIGTSNRHTHAALRRLTEAATPLRRAIDNLGDAETNLTLELAHIEGDR